MSTIREVRTYRGLDDLAQLLEFASRAVAERSPLNAAWHPGDIIWSLKLNYHLRGGFRLWCSDEGIEAVASFVDRDAILLEARPRSEALVSEMVGWAAARVEALRSQEVPLRLSVRALEGDISRVKTLESLGFQHTAPEGVWFRRDISLPLGERAWMAGYSVQDSRGVDPAVRAKAHRDAWNHLDHIGIENATSSFSTEAYLSLRSAPVYDPELDILAVAPDGAFVANCIAWADPMSGVGIFEPVGTREAYRGRGLARMVILEGMSRLKDKGMADARVGTAHFNAPAIATYLTCGFELFDKTGWWTKVL